MIASAIAISQPGGVVGTPPVGDDVGDASETASAVRTSIVRSKAPARRAKRLTGARLSEPGCALRAFSSGGRPSGASSRRARVNWCVAAMVRFLSYAALAERSADPARLVLSSQVVSIVGARFQARKRP